MPIDLGGGHRDRQVRIRALVHDHAPFVRSTLLTFGVPSRDIDDEVQRTFISAARRIDDIRPGAERGFLFSVAMRMAAHARRAHARRAEVLGDQLPEQTHAVTPESLAVRNQTWQACQRLVDELDNSLRAVVVLHAFEEMGIHETAAVLGIRPGTATSRLRRARSHMRLRGPNLAATLVSS